MASPPAEEGPHDARPPSAEVASRLEELTAAVASLEDRLDRLEARLRSDVSDEVHAAAADLRRTVSELGRRLALDLPQMLARHRDTILAELRPSRAGRPRPPAKTSDSPPGPERPHAAPPGGPPELEAHDGVSAGVAHLGPDLHTSPGAGALGDLDVGAAGEAPGAASGQAADGTEGSEGPARGEAEVWVAPGAGPDEASGPEAADAGSSDAPGPGAVADEPSPAEDSAQRRRASLLRRRGPR
jgi:hypothetical protein